MATKAYLEQLARTVREITVTRVTRIILGLEGLLGSWDPAGGCLSGGCLSSGCLRGCNKENLNSGSRTLSWGGFSGILGVIKLLE